MKCFAMALHYHRRLAIYMHYAFYSTPLNMAIIFIRFKIYWYMLSTDYIYLEEACKHFRRKMLQTNGITPTPFTCKMHFFFKRKVFALVYLLVCEIYILNEWQWFFQSRLLLVCCVVSNIKLDWWLGFLIINYKCFLKNFTFS